MHPPSAKTAFNIAVLTLLFPVSRAYAQDNDCDVILKQGLRNTYKELRTGDFRQTFTSAYCNRTSENRGSSSGLEGGGSFDGFGLDFGTSSSDQDNKQASLCGNSGSSMSDGNFVEAMKSVADDHIVDAWLACKRLDYGVLIKGELNGDDLLLTYVFRAAGAISQAKVEGDPYISGAKCNDTVKDGTVINTGGRIQVCKRTGDGPVSVAINTNFQPARFFIPQVPKPVKRPEPAPVPAGPFNGSGTPTTGPFAGQHVETIPRNRLLPGVGIAPAGYTWCVLDPSCWADPGVQSYCFSKEQSGWCHCAKVPPGMPQPSMDPKVNWGHVYNPQ